MPFCSNCGHEVAAGVEACPDCGAVQPITASSAGMRSALPLPMTTGSMGRGFFGRLFDFSFAEWVTPSVISVIYGIYVAAAALVALFILLGGIASGGGAAVGALIAAPLGFLLYVLFARMMLEVVAVIFRIARLAESIEENTRRR